MWSRHDHTTGSIRHKCQPIRKQDSKISEIWLVKRPLCQKSALSQGPKHTTKIISRRNFYSYSLFGIYRNFLDCLEIIKKASWWIGNVIFALVTSVEYLTSTIRINHIHQYHSVSGIKNIFLHFRQQSVHKFHKM